MGRPPDMCCGTISNIRNCDLELSMNRSCTGTNEADEREGGRERGRPSLFLPLGAVAGGTATAERQRTTTAEQAGGLESGQSVLEERASERPRETDSPRLE